MCDDSHTPGTQTELLSRAWPRAGDNTCTEAREKMQSCGETETLGAQQALWASTDAAALCPHHPVSIQVLVTSQLRGRWHLQGNGPQKLREV